MAVQFCEDCGHLLPISSAETIPCALCGKIAKNELLTQEHVATSSNFPSRLRNKLRSQTQSVSRKDLGNGPVTEVTCPQCEHNKATWSEAQLRGADEGTTIFYSCMQCRHRWQENN